MVDSFILVALEKPAMETDFPFVGTGLFFLNFLELARVGNEQTRNTSDDFVAVIYVYCSTSMWKVASSRKDASEHDVDGGYHHPPLVSSAAIAVSARALFEG